MSTLHLSVINDGRTYDDRLYIERTLQSANAKRVAYLVICRNQARFENRVMETKHTDADIARCATEVAEYMARHVAEF